MSLYLPTLFIDTHVIIFYSRYENLPYVGIYKLTTPCLLVRDVELIKDMLIKDFNNFHDNQIEFVENENLMKKNPFVLKGEEWKTMRNYLTQCFTSGKVSFKLLL